MPTISITQGNRLPILTDTLMADGLPVDLTGCSVRLSYQNLRTGTTRSQDAIVGNPATSGVVRYEWQAVDTAEVGPCLGQWEVTWRDGRVACFPPDARDAFEFTIWLPISVRQAIATFRPYIRTLLGDNDPSVKEYRAEQIDDAVRLVINLGKVPGVKLTADGMSLDPPLEPDPTNVEVTRQWARLVLNAAKVFVLPNAGSYAYRTRPLAEVFGEQRDFVHDILQEVYLIDNYAGCQ